ncbi:unnamed protein product [Rhodiola kirilowii]
MADFRREGFFFHIFLIICIATAFLSHRSCAEPTSDKQALIDFISRISYNRTRVRWDPSVSACDWSGVVCDSTQTHVYQLRLPGVGLLGQIPDDTIGRLTQLRVLSLRNNGISGSLPTDFGNLTSLSSLYLQNNRLEGDIPASISNMFLRALFLQNNRFSGNIPATLNTSGLVGFDVSNNNLTGEIPESLSKFPESSFAGNRFLCGQPLLSCGVEVPYPAPLPPPPPSDEKRHHKLSTCAIVILIVIGVLVALILLLLLVLLFFFKRSRRNTKQSNPPYAADRAAEASEASSKDEARGCNSKQKLVFFEPNRYNFELNDLLKASAEVLGKGSTGTSYKAEMDDGTIVAVKRLKEVVAGKRELDSQLALLGQLRHENLVKLIAYYYSKDEKLLISDYIPAGSLSSLLHGSRGSGRPPLDWITRFRIGLTAARGLYYLHRVAMTPHGNMKSSNILVTKSLTACITDYGLYSLYGPSATPNRVTGYRAPEVQQQASMVSFKSDVYSFGVVLLEMLTGKAPNQVGPVGEDGIDLPRWVQSVSGAEVFDAVVVGAGAEEEMVAVLQVAMKCVEVVPERRPEMGEVVKMLELVESGEFQSPLI